MLSRTVYLIILLILTVATHVKPTFITTFSFYALIIAGSLDGLVLLWSARNIVFKHRIHHQYALKNSPIQMEISIVNKSSLFVPHIDIQLVVDNHLYNLDDDENWSTYLYPQRKKFKTVSYRCHYSGPCNLGVDYANLKSFLGLFKTTIKPAANCLIFIYPNCYKLNYAHLNPLREDMYNGRNLTTNQDNEFKDTRDYQIGDPFNRIHWKLSAKSQTLITKEFQDLSKNNVNIWMDTTKITATKNDRIAIQDYIIEAATTFISDCLAKQMNVSLFNQNASHLSTFQDYRMYFATLKFDDTAQSTANNLHIINNCNLKRLYIFSTSPTESFINSIQYIIGKTTEIHLVIPSQTNIMQPSGLKQQLPTSLKKLGKIYILKAQLSDHIITFKDTL